MLPSEMTPATRAYYLLTSIISQASDCQQAILDDPAFQKCAMAEDGILNRIKELDDKLGDLVDDMEGREEHHGN